MDEIKFGMRVKRYARSALERQILESVLIQDERKSHWIMNSRSEYNRCSLPRLTARLGMKEYDKEKMKQLEEDKQIEAVVRIEIGRRKKEQCRNRKEESDLEEWNERENASHKRRKLNDNGEYEKLLARRKPIRKEVDVKEEEQGRQKRRKVEEQPTGKFLGAVLVGYELETIDWDEERRKRKEFIEHEEKIRQERIRKAKRLEESWRLSNLCRKFILENSQVWQERDASRQEEIESQERAERKQRASMKKIKYMKDQERKAKTRKITEMLEELPKKEQEKWMRDQRLEEGKMLKEIKDNLWKKWRGKASKRDKGEEIPREEEKLDRKLKEMQRKIEEHRRNQEQKEQKRERKRKLEEHWLMMKWLVKYIEENKYSWERRRLVQEEENEMNNLYEEWLEKDRKMQIEELMKNKEVEKSREEQDSHRKEKARVRKKMWKDWRSSTRDEGKEKTLAEVEEVDLPGEEERDSPGQGNSLHRSENFPEKLGGEQLEWGGGVSEN